jgi:MFS family permease
MLTAALIGGALLGPMNPVVNLVLQQRTSEQMRGRAMGVVVALAFGAYPLGYLLAGLLIEWAGINYTLWFFAGAGIAITLVALLIRSLRHMDESIEDSSTVLVG